MKLFPLLILIFLFCAPLSSLSQDVTTVNLLFTNDYESAYDPIQAFWKPNIEHIGGVAHIATLIDSLRNLNERTFLFDSGDIFTGTLSKLTKGVLPFELMITMGYDAMCIGNHEFEYGWQTFAEVKSRAPFPVLGANLFYKDTDLPYAQPYTIVEKSGLRIGVIGILGQDAATALIPSNIAGIEVRAPQPIVAEYVNLLKGQVDLIVLLTHQGKTAPMQTNDEDPLVKRDIDADINLAGAVPGIDILLAGHADAGTEKPVIHPTTGTIIMQTYGQGYYLGFLELSFDTDSKTIISHQGQLIPVVSDQLPPHPVISQKLKQYRAQFPDIYQEVGYNAMRLNRKYNEESDLGNLFADVLKEATHSDIGFISPGAIRKDLPAGKLLKRDVLDAFPFTDKVYQIEASGKVIKEILEQSFSLERGLLQVSGLQAAYDLNQPIGQRLLWAKVGNKKLKDDGIYTIGTVEILAQGGDAFKPFAKARTLTILEKTFSAVLLEEISKKSPIQRPTNQRLLHKK